MKNTALTFIILTLLLNISHAQIAIDAPCKIVEYYFNGNTLDNSGNKNNAQLFGPTLSADRFGNSNGAYGFDGVDDSMTVSLSSVIAGASFWVKTSGTAIQTVFATNTGGPPSSNYGILAAISRGEPTIYVASIASSVWGNNGSFRLKSTKLVNDGKWHHIAFSLDFSNSKMCFIYIDGIKVAVSYSGDITSVNTNVFINRDFILGIEKDGELPLEGDLDDFNLYNCTLSENYVKGLFNDGPSHIKSFLQKSNFSVFPNPSQEVLNISLPNSEVSLISILDGSGKEVLRTNANSSVVNIASLNKGSYVILVHTKKGDTYHKNFMKH